MNTYKITYENELDEKLKVPLKMVNKWDLPFIFDIQKIDKITDIPIYVYRAENDNGENIKIIFPIEDYNIYIYKNEKNCMGYHGAALGKRIGICIFKKDNAKYIELRIVHEILHAMGMQADDLELYVPEFLNKTKLILYRILTLMNIKSNHMPIFQREYYKWLLNDYLKTWYDI